ncbi:acyltransferase [Peribacillus kribbensis]|uniref:acyltransferase n=1 Tax=Peribacillus kribbensis TaxID=356658 RepID=UPI00040CE976|nr:acyltransferase [Peribacillus kribbensis]
MLNRLKSTLLRRMGKISNEELTVNACISRGMKVGKGCHGLAACTIDYAHCWLIEIGKHVTFAPQVYLLAHDASTKRYLNFTKIAKVKIHDHAFIGARALIMPGVSIGEGSIIAAGSVVTKSVPAGFVAGGNPAKILCTTTDYISKHRNKMQNSHIYDGSWTIGNDISIEMCKTMSNELESSQGYVK